MKKIMMAALLGAVLLGGSSAKASLSLSSGSVAGVQISSTQANGINVLGLALAADSLGTCYSLKDGSTVKFQICALANDTRKVNFTADLGEPLQIADTFNVSTSSPSASNQLAIGWSKRRNP